MMNYRYFLQKKLVFDRKFSIFCFLRGRVFYRDLESYVCVYNIRIEVKLFGEIKGIIGRERVEKMLGLMVMVGNSFNMQYRFYENFQFI